VSHKLMRWRGLVNLMLIFFASSPSAVCFRTLAVMGKGGKHFYAVAIGRKTGIFPTWGDCKSQVHSFPKAKFKKFKTIEDAQQFVDTNAASSTTKRSASPTQRSAASAYIEPDDKKKTKRLKRSNHNFEIQVNFDGGSRGNPGLAGAGASVVVDETTPKSEIRRTVYIRTFVGTSSTNNEAEYEGLLSGLRFVHTTLSKAKQKTDDPIELRLVVQGDSDLAIKHLKKEYQCRSDKLKPLLKKANDLLDATKRICQSFTLILEHVYRDSNKVADGLANEAMDAKRSWLTTSDDAHTNQSSVLD